MDPAPGSAQRLGDSGGVGLADDEAVVPLTDQVDPDRRHPSPGDRESLPTGVAPRADLRPPGQMQSRSAHPGHAESGYLISTVLMPGL